MLSVPQFCRKTIVISVDPVHDRLKPPHSESVIPTLDELLIEETSVLVINSSTEMAKEITLQLTLKLPGCSIMYAPTIELAKLLLKKRKIDLIVSSPVLPDGSISNLRDSLAQMKHRPDFVVVGDVSTNNAHVLEHSGYEFAVLKRFGGEKRPKPRERSLRNSRRPAPTDTVKNLGADIRNDLNNPLQEIVAMVFVAKTDGASPFTAQALEAIERAAQNMAHIVKGIEEKISKAVGF